MTDAQNPSPDDPYSDDYDGASGQQKSRRLQAAGAVLLSLILAAILGLRSDPNSAGQAVSGSAEATEMPEEIVDPEPTHPRDAQSTQGEEPPSLSQHPEEGSERAGENLLASDAEPDMETAQGTEEENESDIEVEVQANPETETVEETETDEDEDTFLVPVPVPIPVVTGSGTPILPTEEDTEPDEDDPTHIGLPIPLPIPVPLPMPLPVPIPGLPGLPSLPTGDGGVLPVILPLPDGDDEEAPQPIIPIVPIVPVINTTPDGEYWVQLGAFSTSDAGCIVWEDMAAVSPALFDDALKSVLPARSEGGNTVYRLRAGAFDTREEAVIFCDELKATGATCFVVKD